MMDIITSLILIIILGTSRWSSGRSFWKRSIPYGYVLFVIAYATRAGYWTYQQFVFWHGSVPGKYFLPPYQSIGYFLQYAFYRFWSHFLVALIFSLVVFFVAVHFNRKHQFRYFEYEEPYYLALAILAVGYPGLLIYFLLLFLIQLVVSHSHFFMVRRLDRISFYYFWLAVAIVALFINKWLATWPFWRNLII